MGGPAGKQWTDSFDEVHASEKLCIEARRASIVRRLEAVREDASYFKSSSVDDTIGLALSGGGIRSAAFCLGALQGMDAVPPPGKDEVRTAGDQKASIIDRIDYLSTVSGGGYIGASMTAAMSINGGKFPFRSLLDQDETPAVQHIRDHSNFMFPNRDSVLGTVAIYLRGLAVNLSIVAPWVLATAGVFLAASTVVEAYSEFFAGGAASIWALYALGVALILWGIDRSRARHASSSDVRSSIPNWFGKGLLAIACVVFLDVSTTLLQWLQSDGWKEWNLAAFAGILAPLSAVFGFLAPRLAEAITKTAGQTAIATSIGRYIGMAILWIGAAIVPLLLWIAALLLALPYLDKPWPAAAVYGVVAIIGSALALLYSANANSMHRLYRDRLSAAFLVDPGDPLRDRKTIKLSKLDGFKLSDKRANPAIPPTGTATSSTLVNAPVRTRIKAATRRVSTLLSKIFPKSGKASVGTPGAISGLTEQYAPYHLINAAVNVQGSLYANNRGRNADFFLFSRNYVGSRITGYVRTPVLADKCPALDLGTAMAVSGAAFSSNMGASSIAPLRPTLALLNVRLGYWQTNPRQFRPGVSPKSETLLTRWWKLYFWQEVFARLHENLEQLYITDGGHIDNLGIYELLRRKCKLVIVVDGEADAELDFNSLMTVQRYARIDLGVRIDLPWRAIQVASKAAEGSASTQGPHCAIGRINYPGEETGVLVYIKAALTGDESDIVRDYKRRWPKFPHETTLDQFFSEEQFEVYRALGFHVTYALFNGKDTVAVEGPKGEFVPPDGNLIRRNICAVDELLDQVRLLLGLPTPPPAAPPTPPAAPPPAAAPRRVRRPK